MVKLSKQEYEVLKLMAEGYKNNPISDLLQISNKSVSTYVARLRSKLGVKKAMNTHYVILQAQKEKLI